MTYIVSRGALNSTNSTQAHCVAILYSLYVGRENAENERDFVFTL